jgi:rSAM/selenodomain-associated transferase 2
MRISVIIPTLNEELSIAEAILRAKALAPYEIIVADGGSRDGTEEIALRVGVEVTRATGGRGPQLNAGAAIASGEVLLFLHADTWLSPMAVGQLTAAMDDQRVLAGAFRQKIDAAGWQFRWLEWGNALRAGWWGLPYGDQGIFVRRDAFDELGGFPHVPIMEDLIFVRRLRRRVRPVLLDGPIYVSARRWHQRGVVRQTFRNWSLLVAERLGVSPHRLATWYRPHASGEHEGSHAV